jgi:hypothetical protein
MNFAAEQSMKGHKAYASYQMHAWEELSISTVKAVSPITGTPLKRYKVESLLMA